MKQAPECAKIWKQIPAIQIFEFPIFDLLRHTVAVIVIKQWFFCSLVSQGDGRENIVNRKTSQHPNKWRHAGNLNFKIPDICF